MQGLLCAHDAVAQKDYFPRLPEIPLEVDEDEETIKIVQLVKSNEPLVCYPICILYFVLCPFWKYEEFSVGFNMDFIIKVKPAFDFSDRILWLHIVTYRMQFNVFTGIFFAVCVWTVLIFP